VPLLLAATALGVSGCGEADSSEAAGEPEAQGVGPVRGTSSAQLASCSDWRRGTEAERYVTIAEIRGQMTPQSSASAASDLPDSAAYAMFEKICATDNSDSMRLYKLYAPAQAFAPLRTDLEE
jgi:hypothetical protein